MKLSFMQSHITQCLHRFMHIRKLALITLALCNIALGFDSIDEALKNGASKGDVILYGNAMSMQGNPTTIGNEGLGLAHYAYMGNLGYLVGNVGLSYTSGFYKNIRASIGFRSLASFYDANAGLFAPTGGKGDSKADFFNQNQAALAESFIEYFDGDTSVKAGRISIANDWVNMLTDGVWIRNRSFEDLLLEAFWVNQYGRIDYYQMTSFYRPNLVGLYYTGLKYYIINDFLNAKLYTYFAPPIFTAAGGRIDGSMTFLDFELHAYVGYAASIEHNNTLATSDIINSHHNGSAFYAQASFGLPNAFHIAAGYIHTGQEAGWGSLAIMGDSIDPFFTWGGKVLKTQPNVNLLYANISTQVERFRFLITYGTSFYGQSTASQLIRAQQNELNIAMEIGFTHNVIGVLNVLNTHLDSFNIPTRTQVNGGVRLTF